MSSGTKRLHGQTWKRRRQAVLRRDGFRCVLCGSAEDLTVDHIIRRVDHGSNEIENLRTLCRPCHDDITPRWVRGVGYVTPAELRARGAVEG